METTLIFLNGLNGLDLFGFAVVVLHQYLQGRQAIEDYHRTCLSLEQWHDVGLLKVAIDGLVAQRFARVLIFLFMVLIFLFVTDNPCSIKIGLTYQRGLNLALCDLAQLGRSAHDLCLTRFCLSVTVMGKITTLLTLSVGSN